MKDEGKWRVVDKRVPDREKAFNGACRASQGEKTGDQCKFAEVSGFNGDGFLFTHTLKKALCHSHYISQYLQALETPSHRKDRKSVV